MRSSFVGRVVVKGDDLSLDIDIASPTDRRTSCCWLSISDIAWNICRNVKTKDRTAWACVVGGGRMEMAGNRSEQMSRR